MHTVRVSNEFQSTPSQRGRLVAKIVTCVKTGISIHALAKRATPFCAFRIYNAPLFNPRSRKEGDRSVCSVKHLAVVISIHALAKRATSRLSTGACAYGFQSTPSQRGRLPKLQAKKFAFVFQSTPSQRGRRGLVQSIKSDFTISIHALAKRATLEKACIGLERRYFNPRPRKEGDLEACKHCFLSDNFNPRPRKEGDNIHKSLPVAKIISIHALAKRATHCFTQQTALQDIFQSTPS